MVLNKSWIWAGSIIFLAFLSSLILHWNVFSQDISGIHTWRQSQTQLNIRNFHRKDPNILNTRVAHFNGGKDNLYRYEFPVMQWSIAMLQHVFGEDIRVTRISIFIIGFLTLTAFALLLLQIFKDPVIAALGVWGLSFSPVFFYYTVNPLPDNLALCAGFWYLYFAIKNYKKEKTVYHLAAAFFLALATMSKLPYIVLGAVSFVYFLQKWKDLKFIPNFTIIKNALLYILLMLPAFFWYRWVMPGWEGNGILHGIFDEHNSLSNVIRILKYHVKVMFPKLLLNPVSLIFILSGIIVFLKRRDFLKKESLAIISGLIMVILYFMLEINMIDIHHDYYMMPFLPFLYLLLMYGANWAWSMNRNMKALSLLIFLIMPFQCWNQIYNYWTPEISGANVNLFKYQKELKNAIPLNERCIVLNDISYFVFMYKLDKEGYVFKEDYLPVEWVDDMVQNHGVKYMYSDSRKVDESPEMQSRIDTVLMQKGSIKVLKLKGKE
jgi:hypothetical protein